MKTYNDLSGYTIDYEEYDDYSRNIAYVKGDVIIDYYQVVKYKYDLLWNTEDTNMEKVMISDFEAVYFYDNHNFETIVWDDGEYIFSIGSNIGKDALIDIAKSVKKVE